ncbi:MAG: DUF2793 domain-containing protein [Halocynthiibacter sp.]
MPERSTILSLPYIQPSQAQKHVTHNEAIGALDVIVQLAVKSRTTSAPPGTPQDGDRYIVAVGGSAAWAGQDDAVAVLVEGVWAFFAPGPGWSAYVEDNQEVAIFDGAGWAPLPAPAELQNLTSLGVNTTADTTNRIAVAAAATLLSHDGNGHQLKVNKAAETDTASLLFQTGWSGRAEMGLAGSDDFEIKVSADGSNWNTALRLDAANGAVAFPSGGVREKLSAARTWYVDPTLGSDTNDGLAGGSGAFATIAAALDAVHAVDGGGQTLTVALADGTYALTTELQIEPSLVAVGRLQITGNTATPGNVVLTTSAASAISVQGGNVTLGGVRLLSTGTGALLRIGRAADVTLSDVIFGTTTNDQIANDGGQVRYGGACEIDGNAARHVANRAGGIFDSNGQVLTLTSAPNFATAFLACEDGSVATLLAGSFSGAATGPRYVADRNGVINTGGQGAAFLPGDSAGSATNGGLYL